MRLYIVRHAIAVSGGFYRVSDEDRALTEEGIAKMRQSAAALVALNFVPELILCSPLLRARQTAEILLEAFGSEIGLKITLDLAPSGARRKLYREIALYENKLKSLMLVGHQPLLGQIAAEISCGSSDHPVELKKGGVCAIELESMREIPRGSMISLLTPSILHKVVL